jgi:hypothetical protein
MHIAVVLLATSLLLNGAAFAASDLDKPIEPSRPTIRTEIYRGRDAFADCIGKQLLDCALNIQSKNVQQNTNTDAFNAGLFFSAWLMSLFDEEQAPKITGQPAKTDAARFFKTMKEYQTKLQIDNRALCEAARVNCAKVLPSMERWEVKNKAP